MNALEIIGLITCGVAAGAIIYVLVQAGIVFHLVNKHRKRKENGSEKG
jgi:uncharacterized protein (DUF2062 family)